MNDLVEKFKALSIGDKVILIAGVALFIVGFFPWYHAGGGTYGVAGVTVVNIPTFNSNGWQSPGSLWSIIAILLGLAMAGVIAVRELAKPGTLPADVGGFSWPKIELGAAVIAAVVTLIKLVSPPSGWSLSIGAYLGVVAVAALVVGAFLGFQQERSGAPTPQTPAAQ
jgi:hypothetical protein